LYVKVKSGRRRLGEDVIQEKQEKARRNRRLSEGRVRKIQD
jgi:hypothetical protein